MLGLNKMLNKMLNYKETASSLECCDLEEGDIALIRLRGEAVLVYVFRTRRGDPLSMVSLDKKTIHWSDITNNTLKVLKVFKPGETLTVV